MIGINFDKQKAESLIDSLQNGKTIEGIKTVDDMLALAGACHFVVMSHGPQIWKQGNPPQSEYQEHREADEQNLFEDLNAAIEFYSHLTMLTCDGEYDANHEPTCRAAVGIDGDGKRQVLPLEGFKHVTN